VTPPRFAPQRKGLRLPDGGHHFPALVLNADFRPLSYFPLSLWSWQDAIKAVFMDRVSVLSEYETEVRSPSVTMRLPSVIALKDYIPSARRPAFTRFNVFLRDAFLCQYCGDRRPTPDLTFDHVVPRSRGGPDDVGKRGDRVRPLQSAQGIAAAQASAGCSRGWLRGSRRRGSCRITGARFRPTICMRLARLPVLGQRTRQLVSSANKRSSSSHWRSPRLVRGTLRGTVRV
jgi:5-methylcytosine-specific restriction endonuclease McrA